MATRFIENVGTVAGDAVTELSRLKDAAAGNVVPFIVDAVDGVPKYYDRVNSKVRQLVAVGHPPVSCTASSLALTSALHAGRTVLLDRAAGIAVTLPAATGTGDKYRLVIKTTFTGAATIAVVDATDYMIGVASLGIDGGSFVPHLYPTANTGTLATENDTISLYGTANSQGGIKGGYVELEDIATDIWAVNYKSDAGGTEATPFSAAV